MIAAHIRYEESPMTRWTAMALGGVLGFALTARPDDPRPDPKKPPHERILKGDDAKTAAALRKKISEAQQANRFGAAIKLGEELLALRSRVQGIDHWQTVNVYWELVAVSKIAALPADTLAGWRTAIRGATEAVQLEENGQYAKAQPLWQVYRHWCERILGEKHPETVHSYNNLANNLSSQGRNADAEMLSRRTLDLRRELVGEKHPDTAKAFNTLAHNLQSRGRYADALPLLQKSLDLRRELLGEKHPDTATGYRNLAVNLNSQGRAADAEVFARKALDIRRELHGERHHLIANGYNGLAHSLKLQGKSAEAHVLLQKALDLHRELLGERHPVTAISYASLANNSADLGRYADAQLLFQKSLELRRKLQGERHPETAICYRNLAYCLTAQGQYAEARKSLEQARAAYEAARLTVAGSGLDRAAFGSEFSPYCLLACVHASLHDTTAAWLAAEADLARGLSDEAASRGRTTLTQAEQQARRTLTASLSRIQPRVLQLGSKPMPTDAERDEFDKLQEERGDLEVQLDELAVAVSRREVGTLTEVQAAIPTDAALVMWVDAEDRSGEVQEHWGCVLRRTGSPSWERLPGTGPATKWTRDDVRPARLREALASHTASAASVAALARTLQAQRVAPLEKHLDGVKTLYVVPVHAMAGVPVEVLTDKYTVSYVPSGTSLARLKGKPPPAGSGLLAVGDPIFSRPDAKPKPNALPPGGLLVTQVAPGGAAAKARFQRGDVLLRYGDSGLTTVEKLDEAIKAHLVAREVTVTVWREGVETPFTRNVAPGRLGVVLDERPAREAVADRRKTDYLLYSLRGGKWTDLPGTRAEVNQLAKLFGPRAKVLVDGAASERSLDDLRRDDELMGFRYVHLATHGEANHVRALESMLVLAQDGLPMDPLPRVGEPLLDGQLTANEVLEFWKLNAELVTLSACETALGRKGGGDGLLGFAQAFLVAGSRAVCLSLWKVDDAATALLMTRFYQNLLGKRPGLDKPIPKALALAEAKRWLRELSADEAITLAAAATNGVVRGGRGKGEELKLAVPAVDANKAGVKAVKPFAHPRFWAAFVLVGDPN
jgi:CHAT domain-containing protein/tetratricopeptide (TPR) repeat protein